MTPPPPPTSPPADTWLAAYAASHQRWTALVLALSPDEVAGPSYDDDRSIAQVLAHLGSGAQIFGLFLRAGLTGGPVPGLPEFEPIWARWNSLAPLEQAADAVVADRELVDQLETLDDESRRGWHMEMFGAPQDLAGLLRMRLGEHAVHTWDVEVMGDPTATVFADAVALLIDGLSQLVSFTARPPGGALRVPIETTGPTRRFVLVADASGVELQAGDPTDEAEPALQLPAEALLRLVYGRLDPAHTPPFEGDPADLERLRPLLPGF